MASKVSTFSIRPRPVNGDSRQGCEAFCQAPIRNPICGGELEELLTRVPAGDGKGVRAIDERAVMDPTAARGEQGVHPTQQRFQIGGDLVDEPGGHDGVEGLIGEGRLGAVGQEEVERSGPSGPEGAASVQRRLTGSTSGALTLVSVRAIEPPRITASAGTQQIGIDVDHGGLGGARVQVEVVGQSAGPGAEQEHSAEIAAPADLPNGCQRAGVFLVPAGRPRPIAKQVTDVVGGPAGQSHAIRRR